MSEPERSSAANTVSIPGRGRAGSAHAGAIALSLGTFPNYIADNTADGSWASETYEKLGDLSEDYISFCRDGKWGYLKTVR